MTRLRVVGAEGVPAPGVPFADACHAELDKLLKAGATAVFLAATTPEDTRWTSVPSSPALERGIVLDIAEEIIPSCMKSERGSE